MLAEEQRLRELGFLADDETVLSMPTYAEICADRNGWAQNGECFVYRWEIETDRGPKTLYLKCLHDAAGPDAIRGATARRIRLANFLRENGGNAPYTRAFGGCTIVQEGVPGMHLEEALASASPSEREKIERGYEEQLNLYRRLGLGEYGCSPRINFIVTPDRKVFCIDFDFPSATV